MIICKLADVWNLYYLSSLDDKFIRREPEEDVDSPDTANAATTNDRTLEYQNGIHAMHCLLSATLHILFTKLVPFRS